MQAQQITAALTDILDLPDQEVELMLERSGGLRGLLDDPTGAIVGLDQGRVIRLLAALDLVKISRSEARGPILATAEDAGAFLVPLLGHRLSEEFHALFFIGVRLVEHRRVCLGSGSAVIIDGKEVLRIALSLRANRVMIAHNHPSGDPTPSAHDISTTRTLATMFGVLNVDLLDHIIVGGSTWISMRQDGTYQHSVKRECQFLA